MLHKLSGINTDIVLTEGEYGFAEVLDDFKNANTINIVTFNIRSYEDSVLIKALREVSVTTPINIIINFPARRGSSQGELTKQAAIQIYFYLKTLDREKFGDLNVFFNYSNHAKLVMTNNIAYLGSQNFSDASSDNVELGVLINDNAAVNRIEKEIFNSIKEKSERYSTSKYVILCEEIADIMHDLLYRLRNSIFSFYGDEPYFEDVEVIDINDAHFPKEMWERLSVLGDDLEERVKNLSEEYPAFKSVESKDLLSSLNASIKHLVNELDGLARFKNDQEEHMLWDTFHQYDTGDNVNEAMDIAMSKVKEYQHEVFIYVEEKSAELVNSFNNVEASIKKITELIDEISIELIKETVIENIPR
ncbi:phospholipase D-like domain-containing protein [Bacillus pseudomycoides]|uniref:phospholipase D-like domain-containing protein n=1 Tax=Bacillus pseudomycoides TaxID=64104 RepID=UPI0015D4E1E8|nr:phospholipase D-like domain-containing protein [Bacillus pseudomycoides]